MVDRNASGFASNGVMSLKITPGFGKSGMSRNAPPQLADVHYLRLPFLRGRGGMLVATRAPLTRGAAFTDAGTGELAVSSRTRR